jgi:hypothetical protein
MSASRTSIVLIILAIVAGLTMVGGTKASPAPSAGARVQATQSQTIKVEAAADQCVGELDVLDCSNGQSWIVGRVICTELCNFINRGLVRFDLPELPAGATIDDAQLALYVEPHPNNPAPQARIGIHRILDSWDEATVNWSSQPAHDEAPAAVGSFQGGGFYYRWRIFDVMARPRPPAT